jgi:hypothetical protein
MKKKELTVIGLGSLLAVGLVFVADKTIKQTSRADLSNCIYTIEWIDKNGSWVDYKSLDNYETLYNNGVIQRDENGKMLYYVIPIDLDTIKFNSVEIKESRNCN